MMDLMTLDANNQPAKMVEQYDSLIWTERFNTVGDFQITTGDIDRYMALLPEGTRLGLRESNVAMVVETHQIDRKKNAAAVLTIKGRSFESILDRRISIQAVAGGVADWNVVAKIPSDIAYYVIKKICVDGLLTADDIFPSTMVQFPTPADYLTGTGPNRAFTIPRGNLLATVLPFLQTETKADPATTPATPAVVQHGIRAVRPSNTGTAIAVQIYTGTDRSSTIYFDGTRDLLDDGSYLFSKVGSADIAAVIGANTAVLLNKGTVALTGLNRRVMLVDGTTSGVNDEASLVEQGKAALTDASQTAIFNGSINQDLSPYIYGADYFLGDIVKLVGDYGLVQPARVTEYIRSEDSTGVKAYPTLTTLAS